MNPVQVVSEINGPRIFTKASFQRSISVPVNWVELLSSETEETEEEEELERERVKYVKSSLFGRPRAAIKGTKTSNCEEHILKSLVGAQAAEIETSNDKKSNMSGSQRSSMISNISSTLTNTSHQLVNRNKVSTDSEAGMVRSPAGSPGSSRLSSLTRISGEAVPACPVQTTEGSILHSETKGGGMDWRTAYRVPMFSADGSVIVGYRQNSALILNRLNQLSFNDCLIDTVVSKAKDGDVLDGDRGCHEGPEELADQTLQACVIQIPGYDVGEVIGHGGFCCVRKAIHLDTGLPVAIKIVDKACLFDPKDRDRVDREVRVLRQLGGHVSIVALLETFESREYIYLVQEYCGGGSLLDLVRHKRRLSEDESASLFQQLLAALQYCHRRGIVHRDVKLENILLDDHGEVRLIDFGLCGYYVPDKTLRCHCGSPSYAAPEIVARQDYLAPPVDVWSAGVVLFAMLTGYLPFYAKDKRELSRKILRGEWTAPAWISPTALDLLQRMLCVDPRERISLEGIWKHPWVEGAKRWKPPGDGDQGLIRARTDPETGAHIPDPEVVAEWAIGNCFGNSEIRCQDNIPCLLRSLRLRECTALTAGYYLLFNKKSDKIRRKKLKVVPRRKA